MTVVYQTEKLAAAKPEIEALLPAMWAEMALGFGEEKPEPSWQLYFAAEAKNAAFLLVAREDGAMVGYFGMVIYPNLSLKNQLAATDTPYYVVRRRDRALILRSLIRHALAICQKAGVRKATVKTHPWVSAEPVLINLGGREIEKRFMFDLEAAARAKEAV